MGRDPLQFVFVGTDYASLAWFIARTACPPRDERRAMSVEQLLTGLTLW
jgi:hypothetical protein